MLSARVIPIRPSTAPAPGPVVQAPAVQGPPQQVQRVLKALDAAVAAGLGAGWPAGRWLRELRLSDEEAWVGIAPDLGHDGLEAAETAFDTLRRLLPDTDIYVGAAAA